MTTQNDETEVKEPETDTESEESQVEDETLTIDDLSDEEKEQADADLQALKESSEGKITEAGETEEPAEEAATKETPDDKSDKTVEPEKKTEPKPVEGESPRERALRLEVERVKRANRALKSNKLLGDVKPVTPTTTLATEDEEILKAYDPEQLANLDKVFDVLAKKKGLVKQDEFTQQQTKKELQNSFEDWMDSNPEFSEDKDPDGVMWKALESNYKELLTFRPPPRNSKELTKILNGIKKELFGVTTDTTDLKKVEAQKEKIKVSSHSSGSATSPKKSKAVDPEIDSLVKSGALKGFSDEDLKEMGLK